MGVLSHIISNLSSKNRERKPSIAISEASTATSTNLSESEESIVIINDNLSDIDIESIIKNIFSKQYLRVRKNVKKSRKKPTIISQLLSIQIADILKEKKINKLSAEDELKIYIEIFQNKEFISIAHSEHQNHTNIENPLFRILRLTGYLDRFSLQSRKVIHDILNQYINEEPGTLASSEKISQAENILETLEYITKNNIHDNKAINEYRAENKVPAFIDSETTTSATGATINKMSSQVLRFELKYQYSINLNLALGLLIILNKNRHYEDLRPVINSILRNLGIDYNNLSMEKLITFLQKESNINNPDSSKMAKNSESFTNFEKKARESLLREDCNDPAVIHAKLKLEQYVASNVNGNEVKILEDEVVLAHLQYKTNELFNSLNDLILQSNKDNDFQTNLYVNTLMQSYITCQKNSSRIKYRFLHSLPNFMSKFVQMYKFKTKRFDLLKPISLMAEKAGSVLGRTLKSGLRMHTDRDVINLKCAVNAINQVTDGNLFNPYSTTAKQKTILKKCFEFFREFETIIILARKSGSKLNELENKHIIEIMRSLTINGTLDLSSDNLKNISFEKWYQKFLKLNDATKRRFLNKSVDIVKNLSELNQDHNVSKITPNIHFQGINSNSTSIYHSIIQTTDSRVELETNINMNVSIINKLITQDKNHNMFNAITIKSFALIFTTGENIAKCLLRCLNYIESNNNDKEVIDKLRKSIKEYITLQNNAKTFNDFRIAFSMLLSSIEILNFNDSNSIQLLGVNSSFHGLIKSTNDYYETLLAGSHLTHNILKPANKAQFLYSDSGFIQRQITNNTGEYLYSHIKQHLISSINNISHVQDKLILQTNIGVVDSKNNLPSNKKTIVDLKNKAYSRVTSYLEKIEKTLGTFRRNTKNTKVSKFENTIKEITQKININLILERHFHKLESLISYKMCLDHLIENDNSSNNKQEEDILKKINEDFFGLFCKNNEIEVNLENTNKLYLKLLELIAKNMFDDYTPLLKMIRNGYEKNGRDLDKHIAIIKKAMYSNSSYNHKIGFDFSNIEDHLYEKIISAKPTNNKKRNNHINTMHKVHYEAICGNNTASLWNNILASTPSFVRKIRSKRPDTKYEYLIAKIGQGLSKKIVSNTSISLMNMHGLFTAREYQRKFASLFLNLTQNDLSKDTNIPVNQITPTIFDTITDTATTVVGYTSSIVKEVAGGITSWFGYKSDNQNDSNKSANTVKQNETVSSWSETITDLLNTPQRILNEIHKNHRIYSESQIMNMLTTTSDKMIDMVVNANHKLLSAATKINGQPLFFDENIMSKLRKKTELSPTELFNLIVFTINKYSKRLEEIIIMRDELTKKYDMMLKDRNISSDLVLAQMHSSLYNIEMLQRDVFSEYACEIGAITDLSIIKSEFIKDDIDILEFIKYANSSILACNSINTVVLQTVENLYIHFSGSIDPQFESGLISGAISYLGSFTSSTAISGKLFADNFAAGFASEELQDLDTYLKNLKKAKINKMNNEAIVNRRGASQEVQDITQENTNTASYKNDINTTLQNI